MSEQLKAAGFSDSEIQEYNKLKQAGFGLDEINDYYSKKQTPNAPSVGMESKSEESPNVGFKEITKSIAKKAAPYTKHALPIAGAMVGGLGGGVAGPAGSLGGAGLGYAAGAQVQDLIEQYGGVTPVKSTGQELIELPKDVLTGAAMEAGGALVGLPIKKGLELAGKSAPKIYESVAKFRPSLDKTVRDRAVKTALNEKIPATGKGLQKLNEMIDQTNNKISGVIGSAKKSGDKIKTQDILKTVQENIVKWAEKHHERTKPIIDKLDDYIKDIVKEHGDEITVEKAQALKSGIYRRLKDKSFLPFADDATQIERKLSKEFASGVRKELINKYPVLEKLGKHDRNLIELEKELERTVNRTGNWNVLGLQDLAGGGVGAVGGGHVGLAIGLALTRGLRSPGIMSKLSILLNKAAKKKGAPILQRMIGYPIGKAISSSADVEGAIDTAMGATASPAQALTVEQMATKAYLNGDNQNALKLFKKAIIKNPKKIVEYKTAINQILKEIKGLQSRNPNFRNGV